MIAAAILICIAGLAEFLLARGQVLTDWLIWGGIPRGYSWGFLNDVEAYATGSAGMFGSYKGCLPVCEWLPLSPFSQCMVNRVKLAVVTRAVFW